MLYGGGGDDFGGGDDDKGEGEGDGGGAERGVDLVMIDFGEEGGGFLWW